MNRQSTNRNSRMLTLIACFAVVFTHATGYAQERGRDQRIPPLPCCKCIGERATLSLNTGSANWTVTPGPGPIVVSPPLSAWTASIPGAQWIQPGTNPAAQHWPLTSYTYSVSYIVQNCTIPYKNIRWDIHWAADNYATVTAPGLAPSTPYTGVYGFLTANIQSINNTSQAPSPGTYQLTVAVTNAANSYSGVIVNAQLIAECTTDIVKPMIK
jgi:hypothetical protein